MEMEEKGKKRKRRKNEGKDEGKEKKWLRKRKNGFEGVGKRRKQR